MKIIFYAGNIFSIVLLIFCVWAAISVLNTKPSGYAGDAQGQGIAIAIIVGFGIFAIIVGIVVSWLGIRAEIGILPRISLALYLSPIVILIISLIIKTIFDFQSERRVDLEQAVEYGNIENAKKLLRNGISANTDNDSDYNYNSLLQIAAENGDVTMMKILIDANANKIKDSLAFAIDSNKLEAVEFLLELGIDPNFVYRGRAQLTHAKSLEITRALITAGADPHVVDYSKKTILMYAVDYNRSEIVDYLLSLNVDVKAIDDYGKNALHYANFDEDKIISSLLNKNISCKTRDKDGLLPIQSIWHSDLGWDNKLMNKNSSKSHLNDSSKGMRHLVKCSGGIDIKGNNGETILMWKAKTTFYEDVFDFLLELGADINAIDESGKSALFKIPLNNDEGLKTLQYFVTHGATVNLTDADGNTALHVAAGQYRTYQFISLLLSAKADPNFKNKSGLSPFINHVKNGDLDVSSLTAFIEANVDLSIADSNGNIPLSIVLSERKDIDKDVFKLLISTGKNRINGIANHKGETPLMLAAQNDRFNVVKNLLTNGISVSVIDHAGNNVFHHLAMNTNLSHRNVQEFFEILLNAGAQIDLINKQGKTPYDLAANIKHEKNILEYF